MTLTEAQQAAVQKLLDEAPHLPNTEMRSRWAHKVVTVLEGALGRDSTLAIEARRHLADLSDRELVNRMWGILATAVDAKNDGYSPDGGHHLPLHPNGVTLRVLELFYSIYLQRGGDTSTWWLEYGSQDFQKIGLTVQQARSAFDRLCSLGWTKRVGQDGAMLTSAGVEAWERPSILSERLPQPGVQDQNDPRRAMTPTTENLSILFMDLSGWSALRPQQIASYLEKALPKLAQKIRDNFKARHLNTWGDALVAAFGSAREAAECALDIRDFFRRASEADGVPRGLMPRIALHVGEVIVAWNPIIERPDIFGDAVHLAARLEPKTEKGHAFCTQQFADSLRAVDGIGASAHRWGEVELPKDYGKAVAFVVVGANEEPPAVPNAGGG